MSIADDASQRLRQRLLLASSRGVFATRAARVDAPAPEDAESEEVSEPRRPRPGVLPAVAAVSSGGAPGDVKDNDIAVEDDAHVGVLRENGALGSALAKLRTVAREEARQGAAETDFRRNMAALRALGRLMEAVYIRPGSHAPESERIVALRNLVQASRHLANDLLVLIDAPTDSGYARAMAMEAVIDLVSRAWEDRADESDGLQCLHERPLALIREAAVDPQIAQAAFDLAKKTWRPVQSQDQYRETLLMAAHRSFWRLYMLGEHIDGMTADRCRHIATKLMRFLEAFPSPRGDSPEMRASWMSASMGRLTALVCAELRGRYNRRREGYVPSDDEIDECIDIATMGFEGIESHAAKLLDAEHDAERVTYRPDLQS